MKESVLFVALLVPVTALASWHAGNQSNASRATAEARVAAEPGWVPPTPSRRWTCIVIHHSGTEVGGARRFDRAHRTRGWDELGYHFVVGNGSDTADGQVEVGPRWKAQKYGAHCRSPEDYYNEHGIGICLVGNFDQDRRGDGAGIDGGDAGAVSGFRIMLAPGSPLAASRIRRLCDQR